MGREDVASAPREAAQLAVESLVADDEEEGREDERFWGEMRRRGTRCSLF